jgi:NADH-quinone oxidoreductase subunit N
LNAVGVIHFGFALYAVAAGGEFGNISLIFFLYCSVIGGAGAYAAASIIESKTGGEVLVADIAGLERKHYLISAFFTLFLFSLGGMPLTAGFSGNVRVVLCGSLLGKPASWILIFGLFAAAATLARLILIMYVKKPEKEFSGGGAGLFEWALAAICGAAVIALGIWPAAAKSLLVFARSCVIYFE